MALPEKRLICHGYGATAMTGLHALTAALRALSARRRPAVALLVLGLVSAVLAACAAGSEESGLPEPSGVHAPAPTSPVSATLTVERSATRAIPASFFGLSTEYWTLPVDLRHAGLYRRVLSLLHVPGDGPLVLRIGGDSSDHAIYAPERHYFPAWTFALTESFVQRTAAAVRDMGVHVILDLNLVTGTPAQAAAWARAAQAALPPGSIVGLEVGNEPDLYARTTWMRITGQRPDTSLLPQDITAESYARDFARYARALSGIVSGTPLLGPALSHPRDSAAWISVLLHHPHPRLKVISVHEYPYSACSFPGSSAFPTIGRVLSQRASAGLAASVAPAVAIARRAGLPVRVTEFNSVTCGGRPGVSNTFATALWAPDAGFELLKVGAQSIDLHARQYTYNGPFSFSRRGLEAHPLLYGLIMFVRTLSPNAQLLRSQLHVGGAANVKAWAVGNARGALKVLVIDKSARGVMVNMNLPATGAATIQRLQAPSVHARTGVTLDGQWLNRNGDWQGRRVTQRLSARGRRYRLWVPRYSAALVSVPMTPSRPASAGPKLS